MKDLEIDRIGYVVDDLICKIENIMMSDEEWVLLNMELSQVKIMLNNLKRG